jgi:hypothetical protein
MSRILLLSLLLSLYALLSQPAYGQLRKTNVPDRANDRSGLSSLFTGNEFQFLAPAPNPAGDNTVVSFLTNGKEEVRMVMFNAGREVVLQKTFRLQKGSHQIRLALYDFPEGNYTIRMKEGKKTIDRPLMIRR